MAQLVELKKHEETFSELGVEIIAVFREEKKGVEGLEIIDKKIGGKFTYALDLGKEHTARYSPGRREFHNYVIGPDGKIVEIIEGDLRNRAKSEQLIKSLKSIGTKDK